MLYYYSYYSSSNLQKITFLYAILFKFKKTFHKNLIYSTLLSFSKTCFSYGIEEFISEW